MSTRCTINFMDGKELVAKVYRHSDGYPNEDCGVLADLKRFFQAVKDQCDGTMYGTRFDDPSYLTAKFIVWQAGENGRYAQDYKLNYVEQIEAAKATPLNFGSLGVMSEDPGDIEYTYFIDCGKTDKSGLPTVSYKKV